MLNELSQQELIEIIEQMRHEMEQLRDLIVSIAAAVNCAGVLVDNTISEAMPTPMSGKAKP